MNNLGILKGVDSWRGPDAWDYDWEEAFKYATGFGIDDVAEVGGHRDGENDGASWLMWGRLKDGRYFYLSAGCDYTGWDCQAGGSGTAEATFEEMVRMAMDEEGREHFGLKVGDPLPGNGEAKP